MIFRLPAAFKPRGKRVPSKKSPAAQVVDLFSQALTLKERTLTQGAEIIGLPGKYPAPERALQEILNDKRSPTDEELARMLAFVRE